jgi:hypothetical protein
VKLSRRSTGPSHRHHHYSFKLSRSELRQTRRSLVLTRVAQDVLPVSCPLSLVFINPFTGSCWLIYYISVLPFLSLLLVSPRQSPLRTPIETSGTASPPDFSVSGDDDLANPRVVPLDVADKDEPSAADYDPTQDMREDRRRHDKRHFGDDVSAAAYDETEPMKQDVLIPKAMEQLPSRGKANDTYDMFAEDDDDMFAEEPPQLAHTDAPAHAAAKSAFPQPQELDMSMMDNWDDP